MRIFQQTEFATKCSCGAIIAYNSVERLQIPQVQCQCGAIVTLSDNLFISSTISQIIEIEKKNNEISDSREIAIVDC